MRMYIPEIFDVITLTEDWTFNLHHEHRNTALIYHLEGITKTKDYEHYTLFNKVEKKYPVDFTFHKGTQLKVHRIYIRQGSSDYSSLTFSVVKSDLKLKGMPKFWAKLTDVNNIQFEVTQTSVGVEKIVWHFCNKELEVINDHYFFAINSPIVGKMGNVSRFEIVNESIIEPYDFDPYNLGYLNKTKFGITKQMIAEQKYKEAMVDSMMYLSQDMIIKNYNPFLSGSRAEAIRCGVIKNFTMTDTLTGKTYKSKEIKILLTKAKKLSIIEVTK